MRKNNKSKIHKPKKIRFILILIMFSFMFPYIYLLEEEQAIVVNVLYCGGILLLVILFLQILKLAWKKRKLIKSKIRRIDKMDGLEFEEYLIQYFRPIGYRAEGTKKSGDYGVDIILTKAHNKIIVQAKHKEYKNVGIKAVQEVVGALRYYEAPLGLVVTNSFFTANAKALAKSNGIILWDREVITNFYHKKRISRMLTRCLNA